MSNPSVQVDTLIRELHVSSVRAQKLFTERTAEQLLHKPDERSWSAAECLEHLNLTNRSYRSRLEPILAHLRSRNVLAVKPFRLNCNAAVLKYWLEPPSRLRLPTSARFLPLRVQDPGPPYTIFALCISNWLAFSNRRTDSRSIKPCSLRPSRRA
jgi:hypothetical protein